MLPADASQDLEQEESYANDSADTDWGEDIDNINLSSNVPNNTDRELPLGRDPRHRKEQRPDTDTDGHIQQHYNEDSTPETDSEAEGACWRKKRYGEAPEEDSAEEALAEDSDDSEIASRPEDSDEEDEDSTPARAARDTRHFTRLLEEEESDSNPSGITRHYKKDTAGPQRSTQKQSVGRRPTSSQGTSQATRVGKQGGRRLGRERYKVGNSSRGRGSIRSSRGGGQRDDMSSSSQSNSKSDNRHRARSKAGFSRDSDLDQEDEFDSHKEDSPQSDEEASSESSSESSSEFNEAEDEVEEVRPSSPQARTRKIPLYTHPDYEAQERNRMPTAVERRLAQVNWELVKSGMLTPTGVLSQGNILRQRPSILPSPPLTQDPQSNQEAQLAANPQTRRPACQPRPPKRSLPCDKPHRSLKRLRPSGQAIDYTHDLFYKAQLSYYPRLRDFPDWNKVCDASDALSQGIRASHALVHTLGLEDALAYPGDPIVKPLTLCDQIIGNFSETADLDPYNISGNDTTIDLDPLKATLRELGFEPHQTIPRLWEHDIAPPTRSQLELLRFHIHLYLLPRLLHVLRVLIHCFVYQHYRLCQHDRGLRPRYPTTISSLHVIATFIRSIINLSRDSHLYPRPNVKLPSTKLVISGIAGLRLVWDSLQRQARTQERQEEAWEDARRRKLEQASKEAAYARDKAEKQRMRSRLSKLVNLYRVRRWAEPRLPWKKRFLEPPGVNSWGTQQDSEHEDVGIFGLRLPGVLIEAGKQRQWSADALSALYAGLTRFENSTLILEQIFQEYCGEGGALREYQCHEIIVRAVALLREDGSDAIYTAQSIGCS